MPNEDVNSSLCTQCFAKMAINTGEVDNKEDPQTDSIWILSSTFIIFTMQSGFGLLESGSVSVKNELNIMVKNAVDVVFGGLSYWIFGYGLSFGESGINNPVFGWGSFCVNSNDDKLGWIYSKFFFQASFATTATTIVSGAMAERTKLTSYMVFSVVNTVLFALPAHWVWATNGWLYSFGIVDIAGAGPVHLVGGLTGFVATVILKPRYRRYKDSKAPQMSSPTNAVLGMFMLWWGWLGFNCGSTFGISGSKWKLAARSAASTLCSSVSGGVAGFLLSYIVKDRKFDVTYLINGLLGSLVSITAICALVQPWEGIVIGLIGSVIANGSVALLDKLKIDDPVGCVGTHAMSGAWGLLAAGLFTRDDSLLDALYLHNVRPGLFYGGGFRQLGVQALGVAAIGGWSILVSFVFLKLIDFSLGLRVSLIEEIIGADIVEHGIGSIVFDRKTKRIIHQTGDSEREIQTSDELATIHERELRAIRDRSLSRFSHLLGHSSRRKTAEEINTEISQERYRYIGEVNGNTVTGMAANQRTGMNRSNRTNSRKQSRFRSLWRKVRAPRRSQIETLHQDDDERFTSRNYRTFHGANGYVTNGNHGIQTSNGHVKMLHNDRHGIHVLENDSEGLDTDLTDISESGETVQDVKDIVVQLTDDLPTISHKTSALVNIVQTTDDKIEMTHI